MRKLSLILSWLLWTIALFYVSATMFVVLVGKPPDSAQIVPNNGTNAVTLFRMSFSVCLALSSIAIFLRHFLFVRRRKLHLDSGVGAMMWILLALCSAGFLLGVLSAGFVAWLTGSDRLWAWLSISAATVLLLLSVPIPPPSSTS